MFYKIDIYYIQKLVLELDCLEEGMTSLTRIQQNTNQTEDLILMKNCRIDEICMDVLEKIDFSI